MKRVYIKIFAIVVSCVMMSFYAEAANDTLSMVVQDTIVDAEKVDIRSTKSNPVFFDFFAFANGGLVWQSKSKPDYFMPSCNVGGAFILYSNKTHQFRLSVGYEYAALTKSVTSGRFDTHWVTLDFCYRYSTFVLGVKSQYLCEVKQQGELQSELLGFNKECFNKVACNGYFGVSMFNVLEMLIDVSIIPMLNKERVAFYRLDSDYLSYIAFSIRFNIPVFTTGRNSEILSIY